MSRFNLILFSSLLSFILLLVGLSEVNANSATANRSADPVIITGSQLTPFSGVPITDVVLLAYDGGWQPIPFQIDEKMIEADDTTPDFVVFEDGLIDADDELVFMARDAGQATTQWPDDAAARDNARVAITIVDNLRAVSGSVYLFRSSTLPRSATQYVTLDRANEEITTISYTLGFNSTAFLGIDRLMLNGNSADLIDRQKLRVTIGNFLGSTTQNEEALAGQFTPFTSIVTGPVRLVEGGDFGYAFYQSHVELASQFDIAALNAQIPFGSVTAVRTSLDHNPANQTQLVDYFDSNGVSTTIDGVADPLVSGNLRDWYQVSGGASGGYVAVSKQLSADGGTLTTYYADNTAPNGDTGDMQQFADTGVDVQNPSGIWTTQQAIYVLPPHTSANVGADYQQRAAQPLSATLAVETYGPTSAVTLTAQAATSGATPASVMLIGLWIALLLLTKRKGSLWIPRRSNFAQIALIDYAWKLC